MTEQLQNSISAVVDLSKEGIINGVKILSEQVPELCNQILLYGLMINIMGVIIVGLLFIFAIYLFIRYLKKETDEDVKFIFYLFGALFFALFFSIIIKLSLVIIQINIAPKVYLLSYLKGIL
ncbi:MAG: hypothetical protein WC516_06350 [Patescibacteria group bacterium]|jgi:hypothetical protein